MNDETAARPVLGGRYELGELLGRGGMAEVRKGRDVRLDRVVAVKRLRTDLASDPTFQARFHREAQSAASLNHPSIVGVYDSGEENAPGAAHPQPYIVMEYVAGRTLRDILREGRRILPERALEIVCGVLTALDYSHRNGIIHRDIKPANVMLTPSGDVKVMDFGIARALADSTSTMTQTAAVIGTAQYLSPEQARGETVDSRSDVYSTGCLLYELLTGRPPFQGDSPVSVAYQHVREQAPPPSAVDPSLPPEIDAIVMKALAKPIEERYQSAAAMRADIERYLAGHPVTAPPPVVVPPALDGEPAGATSVLRVTEEDEPRRSRWPLVLLGLLLAGLLAAGLVWGLDLLDTKPQQTTVPRVTGMTLAKATQTLKDNQLEVGQTRREANDEVPAGRVVSQSPDPLTKLDEGSAVNLVLSAGRAERAVPNVLGLDKDEAKQQLEAADFKVVLEAQESDEDKDTVVDTDPAVGDTVEVGSTVTVFFATGPVKVPSVVGLTEERARAKLDARGFQVRVVPDSSTPAEKGTVLDQDPEAGEERPKGSTVFIVVSAFEEPSASPSPSASPTESLSPSPTP